MPSPTVRHMFSRANLDAMLRAKRERDRLNAVIEQFELLTAGERARITRFDDTSPRLWEERA